MLVSFLLPTRNMPNETLQSLETLINNASTKNKWEVLIAIDSDDEPSLNIIPKIDNLFSRHDFCEYNIIITERQGYFGLNYYYNKLAEMAQGELLFLWNDDVMMKSTHWDNLLKNDALKWPDKICFFPIETNILDAVWHKDLVKTFGIYSSGFPIVRKEWLNIVGHLTKDFRNDSYIWYSAVGYSEPCRVCITHMDKASSSQEDYNKDKKYSVSRVEFKSNVQQDNYLIQQYMWELKYNSDKFFQYNDVLEKFHFNNIKGNED